MKHLLLLLLSVNLFATVSVGKLAPNFDLLGQDGASYKLSDFKGKTVVLEWTNHGCPFVKKHYGTNNMQSLQQRAKNEGIIWLSIVSSAEGRQGYVDVKAAKQLYTNKGFNSHALLLDPSGKVGKQYGAVTTPHMYVIDKSGNLVYNGAIDSIPSANPEDVPKAKNYLGQIMDDLKVGKAIKVIKNKPYGCSVKYSN